MKFFAFLDIVGVCLAVAFAAGLVLALASVGKAQEQDFY